MWERGGRQPRELQHGAHAGWLALLGASAFLAAGCGEAQPPPFGLSSLDGGALASGAAGATASAGADAGVSAVVPPARAIAYGTWAIVAEEMDATVVEIDQQGNGKGCQAGWPAASLATDDFYVTDYCGPVTAQIDGDQILFDLALPAMGDPLHYAMFGALSARSTRIGGIHHVFGRRFDQYMHGSAIRYDREDEPGAFPEGAAWPDAIAKWYGADFITTAPQGPFVPDKRYRLRRAWNALGGDLGEFLGTELSIEVNADSVVVHAGPVEKTLDARPVRLAIHFTSGQATDVDVELPSGEVFSLTAAPPL